METKSIWSSKTFWVNTVGGLLIPVLTAWGFEITPEEIALVFGVVNIGLRLWTKRPVHVAAKPNPPGPIAVPEKIAGVSEVS